MLLSNWGRGKSKKSLQKKAFHNKVCKLLEVLYLWQNSYLEFLYIQQKVVWRYSSSRKKLLKDIWDIWLSYSHENSFHHNFLGLNIKCSDRPIWKFSFNRYRYAHHNIYGYRYWSEENRFTDTDTDMRKLLDTDTDADTDMKNC